MADPETPARARSKRKRWTALPEPEDVTAEILNELQKSRLGIDKKLAKHNHSFMQTQVRERQRFIDYCGKRIRNLHDSVRPIVVVQLLSSEDFAVEMNFSELHTSSSKSLLTWSCTDDSLADSSWRTDFHDAVLQQCAEDVAAASPRITRATSKGSSSRAASSTPFAEPPGHPALMTFSEASDSRGVLTENDEDDVDILSSSDVTIAGHRKAKIQESPASPLSREPPSTRKRQDPAGQETLLKRTSALAYRWSQQECDVLRSLCYGKDEVGQRVPSPFWRDVSAQLPGRTQGGCFMKWKQIGRRPRKEKANESPRARKLGGKSAFWSEEELRKLEICVWQQPRRGRDWEKIAAQIPGRTSQACSLQYRRKLRGVNFENLSETQPQGVPVSAADAESVQGNLATQEGEGDGRKNPDGENAAVL